MMKKQPTEEELQAKEDLMMKSSEEKYEEDARRQNEEVREQRAGPQSADRMVVQLEKDVELLKVQIELIKQNKQVADERFSKFSEQLGEIRATVLDSERDAATIKVQAEKAIELISMVQPERLMTEVKKLEAKIEAAKGVEEKFSAMQQKLVEELKDLRQRTEVIRGSETMLKLNEEVKTELSTALQVQSKMEQRADKIEAVYADFQSHFYEYQKVFDRMKELDSEFKDIMKDFNVFKVKVDSSASKSDFLKFKNEFKEYGESIDSKIIEVDKSLARGEMLRADVMKDVKAEMEENNAQVLRKVTTAEQATEKINSMQSELQKSILAESLKFKKDFDQRISALEKTGGEIGEMGEKLDALEKGLVSLNLVKSDVEKGRKDLASMAKSLSDLQSLEAESGKSIKKLAELEKDFEGMAQSLSSTDKRVKSIETERDAYMRKMADIDLQAKQVLASSLEADKRLKAAEGGLDSDTKQLASLENSSKSLQQSGADADRRLKALETRTQEYLQKSERKLDAAISDVSDNTAVVRDLVKEIYGLKAQASNAISKNDLSNLQKAVNEKLIVFDMSLIRLEHHINDYEKILRDLQREYEDRVKTLQKDIYSKFDELENVKGNFPERRIGNKNII